MDAYHYMLAFGASFLYVGAKSAQQLNVIHRKFLWILPTSWIMSALEVFVVASIARNPSWTLIFWVGLGSGLGSMVATWLHYRINHVES